MLSTSCLAKVQGPSAYMGGGRYCGLMGIAIEGAGTPSTCLPGGGRGAGGPGTAFRIFEAGSSSAVASAVAPYTWQNVSQVPA